MARYGTDSMPETARTVADSYDISREDQDAFALRWQQRAARAIADGRLVDTTGPDDDVHRRGTGHLGPARSRVNHGRRET